MNKITIDGKDINIGDNIRIFDNEFKLYLDINVHNKESLEAVADIFFHYGNNFKLVSITSKSQIVDNPVVQESKKKTNSADPIQKRLSQFSKNPKYYAPMDDEKYDFLLEYHPYQLFEILLMSIAKLMDEQYEGNIIDSEEVFLVDKYESTIYTVKPSMLPQKTLKQAMKIEGMFRTKVDATVACIILKDIKAKAFGRRK